MTQAIDVRCEPAPGGWTCSVEVGGPGAPTSHVVSVAAADLDRLAPGADDPEDLVRRSFVFLLAREPRESILGRFDLPLIGRYFPEYEREIGRQGDRIRSDAILRRALEAVGCHDSRVRFGTGLARRRV